MIPLYSPSRRSLAASPADAVRNMFLASTHATSWTTQVPTKETNAGNFQSLRETQHVMVPRASSAPGGPGRRGASAADLSLTTYSQHFLDTGPNGNYEENCAAAERSRPKSKK
ncbi:unnamed protein product, partial [Polarella glacialis]